MAIGSATGLLEAVFEAIDRGNAERVLGLLGSANEGARRRMAPKVRRMQQERRGARWLGQGQEPPSPQRVAAVTARIATETPGGIARLYDWDGDPVAVDSVLAGRAVAARGREFAESVVDRLLEPDRRSVVQGRWDLLRWLVRNEIAPRPDDARYALALTMSLTTPMNWRDPNGIYEALIADPGLLDEEIWRLFEVDVVLELDQQRVYHAVKGRPATISVGKENRWHCALIRLAAEGRVDRDRLLDASLTALAMDFRASRIGWHGDLHEGLEPSREERATRISRYAALLSSSNPAVVRVGLAGLEPVIDRVPADQLASRAVGPLGLKEKKYAIQMLRLLERALGHSPEVADELLSAVAQGLAHARVDVQERTLELLERSAPQLGPPARAAVLALADSVAPTLRARVDDLLGMSTTIEPDAPAPEDGLSLRARVDALEQGSSWHAVANRAIEQAARGRWPDPRDTSMDPEMVRRICWPVMATETLDDLIEVSAAVLEGDATGEQVERMLDGACRLCDQRDAATRRRTAALLKRADELLGTPHGSGVSSRDIAALLLRGWFARDTTLVGLYSSKRLSRIGATVLGGKPRSLEALPTHVGGWVDPAILEERRHRDSDSVELACATARVPDQGPHEPLVPRISYFMDWRNVRRLGDSRVADQLLPLRARGLSLAGILAQVPESWRSFSREANRCITDDDLRNAGVEDVAEARRMAGDPVLVFDGPSQAEDPAGRFLSWMYGDPTMRGWKREVLWAADRGAARWLMSLYPSRPEVFFALAATNAFVFAEDNLVHGCSDVVIERALEPTVQLGHSGWFAVASALLVRAADLRRLASDVVVATVSDGRFDPEQLAAALGWLLAEGVGNPSRFTPMLADAARTSPLHAAQVLRSLWALVPLLDTGRRGIHEPLELALRLATELRFRPEEARGFGVVLNDLVERSPRSKAGAAARALATFSGASKREQALQHLATDSVFRWAESVSRGEIGAPCSL